MFDSYIASGIDDTLEIPFTYYYKTKSKLKNIKEIKFENEEALKIERFVLENAERSNEYKRDIIRLNIRFLEQGIFKEEYIKINFEDGSSINFPIGIYVFDIGRKEAKNALINTYTSMVAVSNPNRFIYDYQILDPKAFITEIKYGDSKFIKSETGLEPNGEIEINSEIPIRYIKTKITVKRNNKEYIYYGKGFYSGAINISKENIKYIKEQSEILYKSINSDK